MSEHPSSREAILAAVRSGLSAARARSSKAAPPAPAVMPAPRGPADPLAALRARLAEAGVSFHEARDEAQAGQRLEAICAELGARRIALSDAPLARRVAEALRASCGLLPSDATRSALFEADLGLSCVQWAVAETGTLILDGERERHRLVSLVPRVHVALLPERCVLPTLDDALARLAQDGASALPRAITFITGPSRTADIEMRLVVGVHGPEVLHVILLRE